MPPGDRPPVLVWRRGNALLAAEVDAVLEVAAVSPEGTARSREGDLPLAHLPGLPRGPATRAVVLRTDGGLVALAVDGMEGIRAVDPDRVSPPPAWLDGLDRVPIQGIVVLDDDRLAALLAVDRLVTGP